MTKEHKWYVLTDIIPKVTKHRKLKKKEDQSGVALFFLTKGTRYSLKQLWRQSVEQRLKERPLRDCPTWGFIL